MITKTKVGLIGALILGAIIAVAVCSGFHPATMFGVVAGAGAMLAAAPVVLTEEQVREFQSILGELKGGWATIKHLPEVFKDWTPQELKDLPRQIRELRRTRAEIA